MCGSASTRSGYARLLDEGAFAPYHPCMSIDQLETAIAALRGAGHIVEAIAGIPGVYRVDECGAQTVQELWAMAAQLDAPEGSKQDQIVQRPHGGPAARRG